MCEKDIGEKVVDIMKAIDELPEEAQDAIYLSTKSIGFFRELCRNPGTTREGIEKRMEKSRAKNDYVGQILAGLALHYMDGSDN